MPIISIRLIILLYIYEGRRHHHHAQNQTLAHHDLAARTRLQALAPLPRFRRRDLPQLQSRPTDSPPPICDSAPEGYEVLARCQVQKLNQLHSPLRRRFLLRRGPPQPANPQTFNRAGVPDTQESKSEGVALHRRLLPRMWDVLARILRNA